MSNIPTISVLVIAYNAARTLTTALDSILCQRFRDFELLLIDDGSTDETLSLVKEYAERDKRIKWSQTFHQGVAVARQKALNWARGDYILFVDADDWIEPDTLKTLCSAASKENAEIVICDFWIHTLHSTELSIQDPCLEGNHSAVELFLTKLHGALWNKLIKRELFERYNIRFIPGLNCLEDLLVILKLVFNNIRITYVHKALYHYDKRAASITNTWIDVPANQKVLFLDNALPLVQTPEENRAFDNYVALIAYGCIFSSKAVCPDYPSLFSSYQDRIFASGLSLKKKRLIRLYLKGIRLPLRPIKLLRIRFNRGF